MIRVSSFSPNLMRIESAPALGTLASADIDSDGDGLYDWEELLWGTNPHKQDSRGDGVSDAEYVSRLKAERLRTASLPNTPSRLATNTGELGKSLFADYMLSRQGGMTPAEMDATVAGILDNAANQYNSSLESRIGNMYTLQNLTVISANEQNVRLFGNRFAEIFMPHAEVIFSPTGADFNSLPQVAAEVATSYRSMAKDLSAMAVPATMAHDFVSLLKALSGAAIVIDDIAKLHSDPLVMLLAISGSNDMEAMVGEYLLNLQQHILSSGIIFSESEPGIAWTR